MILLLKYMPVCCSPLLEADCEDIVFDKMEEWSKKRPEQVFYKHTELLLHNKNWDVVNRDKEGLPKEHGFVDWCRRIARHRTKSTTANSAATEHANNDNPFQKWARVFLHTA